MEEKKKDILIWAIAKAIFSTAVIGMAIQSALSLQNVSWSEPEMVVFFVELCLVCLLGTVLYVRKLKSLNLIASARNYFQIYDTDFGWDKHVACLFRSWEWPVFSVVFIDTALTFGLYFGMFGVQSTIVALLSSALIAYGWRNDGGETVVAHASHIAMGYLFGLMMVLAGIYIGIAVSAFGAMWVSLLIIVDVSFTGVYTYLDLLEWVHATEVKEKELAAFEAKEQSVT